MGTSAAWANRNFVHDGSDIPELGPAWLGAGGGALTRDSCVAKPESSGVRGHPAHKISRWASLNASGFPRGSLLTGLVAQRGGVGGFAPEAPPDFLVAKTGGEPLLGRYGKKGTGDLGWTFFSGNRGAHAAVQRVRFV